MQDIPKTRMLPTTAASAAVAALCASGGEREDPGRQGNPGGAGPGRTALLRLDRPPGRRPATAPTFPSVWSARPSRGATYRRCLRGLLDVLFEQLNDKSAVLGPAIPESRGRSHRDRPGGCEPEVAGAHEWSSAADRTRTSCRAQADSTYVPDQRLVSRRHNLMGSTATIRHFRMRRLAAAGRWNPSARSCGGGLRPPSRRTAPIVAGARRPRPLSSHWRGAMGHRTSPPRRDRSRREQERKEVQGSQGKT